MSQLAAVALLYVLAGLVVSIIALIAYDGVDEKGGIDFVRWALFFLLWPGLVVWFVVWWIFTRGK